MYKGFSLLRALGHQLHIDQTKFATCRLASRG